VKAIELRGPLTEAEGERVAAAIRSAAGRTIDLRIDSEGGKLGAAIRICLEIEEHDAPVFATVTGQASSAAGLVAMAADLRRIDRRGLMLIHHASRRSASADALAAIAEYSGQPQSTVRGWMDAERTFDAHEALAAGLVDRIVSVSAGPTVFVREPVKRAPTKWLRSWREDFERLDLRAVA
jgi:ATP-dependent protease ClpP protease subunit